MNLLGWLARSKFIAKTARAPDRSPFGATASRMMSHINRETSTDAVDRLAVNQGDCVLELGPGSGWGIRAFATRQPRRMIGVEISPRFRAELKALELPIPFDIHGSDAIDMSDFLENDSVDRVLAVNVVYFLNPLDDYVNELYRVMAKDSHGLLACKFDLVRSNHDAVFVNKDARAITNAFEAGGFAVSREQIDLGEEMKSYTAIHFRK